MFNQVPPVYFCFYFHYSRRCVKKDLALIYVKASVLPMFSSKSFIVSGLTFGSLIHFEFIFLYGVRKYSGEGNGTPLQYSCLENPMDGGAWWGR